MRSSARRGLVAAPTALALALGGVLLAAGPASAAAPVTITSPAPGSTYDNSAGLPQVVPITGTGLPTTDDLVLTYDIGTGTPAQALFSGTTHNDDGSFFVNANFGQLPPGETTVLATVAGADAQSGLADPEVTPLAYTFELAVAPNPASPFTVTYPGTGTVVDTTTPVFTGTAQPGSTVTVTYSNKNLGNSTAGTGIADLAGNYSIPTTFLDLAPGSLGTGANVTQSNPDAQVGRLSVNFTFAQAPVPAIAPTITATPDEVTVDEATTTGVAIAATGFSPGEEITTVVTDSEGAVVELADRALNYYADDTVGAYADTVVFADDVLADDYTITLTGVRSGIVQAVDVTVADEVVLLTPTPVITSPTEGQVVTGGTVTISGTGPVGTGIVLTVADSSFLDGTVTETPAAGRFYITDLADPILVDDAGNWTVSVELLPGEYVTQAIAAELNADGSVNETGGVSEPSNVVAFSLVAAPAAVVPPVVTPAAPVARPAGLAYTGSEASQGVVGAALLLLLGGGLLVAARRRRALTVDSAE
ncbi:LPXTG cell wall anchor domain-containing protein [Frigoribacterium sp. PhB107]|uniref:LPXTG cell wall anchor domain-containing protein n=1 Tax=Frigoribacterium sp. PhB107 TaxID=2485172 RepID=UPI0011CE3EE8|nr:LPXTG cell wall anchor domain-containing protein [Frigoribacterium sp. PhB107]